MSVAAMGAPQNGAFAGRGLALNVIPTLVFAALMLAGLATLVTLRGGVIIEDDARYYTVIAENIIKTGRSTFDGQVLTNGYHPVWLGILVVVGALNGLSDAVIVSVELLLAMGGVYLMLQVFRSSSLALRLVFVSLFAIVATPLVCRGMEVSAFVFAFGLFARTLQRFDEGEAGPLAMGLAAGLAIGSRLDSAVFILPMLVFVAGIRRALAPGLVVVMVGAVYAVLNLYLFGIPFPISGAIKSLGGLQVNARYLQQLTNPFDGNGVLAGLLGFWRLYSGKMVMLALLCSGTLLLGRSRATPWVLAYVLGLCLYLAKLIFGSSWIIWSWYAFPMYIGLFVLFLAFDGWTLRLAAPLRRWQPALVAVLSVLAGMVIVARSNRNAVPVGMDFEEINKLAVEQLGPILKGERVAMGDRAGSFAHHYRGPVTQTEGLVNDRAFLEVLQRKGDVKALLCARGVRYVIAYQVDLGAYESVSVPVLRKWLTQYDSPAITLSRKDEVGRVFDLKRYNASLSDEGDSYLYAWRLNDCPVR